jgi:UPF0716 protein FxsA
LSELKFASADQFLRKSTIMPIGLFLVLVAVPLIEIAILIKIGQWIGFFPTLLIVILTAIAGTYVLHSQGIQVARRAVDSLSKGQPPIAPIIDGSFLLIAGVLLLTPGILTDLAGIALLIPSVRQYVSSWVISKLLGSNTVHVQTSGWKTDETRHPDRSERADHGKSDPGKPGNNGQGPLIEGEFERIDERTIDPSRRKDPN